LAAKNGGKRGKKHVKLTTVGVIGGRWQPVQKTGNSFLKRSNQECLKKENHQLSERLRRSDPNSPETKRAA